MSATIIVIIFILLIMASIAVIAFVQLRERMQLAKKRRITSLEEAHRRVHRLMSEIPPQYLTHELHLLLAERAVEALTELKALRNDNSLDAQLTEDQQLLHNISHNKLSRQPTRIDTAARVAEIRFLLEALYRFIELRHKTGKIESQLARNYLKYILYLIHRSQADLALHEARMALKQKQLRRSIHYHHTALSELERCKDYPLAMKTILELKTRIKEMQKEADQESQAHKASQQNQAEALGKEWSKFTEDDASWKKKAQYDG